MSKVKILAKRVDQEGNEEWVDLGPLLEALYAWSQRAPLDTNVPASLERALRSLLDQERRKMNVG